MSVKETIWEEAEDVKDSSWVNSAASCGVSEAAAVAGLYTGHRVKDELVVGPECLQPRAAPNSLLARVKEEVKEEDSEWEKYEGHCGVSEAAARAGLYAGHIVKDELVLGPEGLQPADIVFSLRPPCSGTSCAARLSARSLSVRAREQLAMTCSVRLERLRVEPSLRTEIKETHDEGFGVRTEKEAYTCDTCGKRYTHLRSLVRHNKIHTGQTPYSCDVCNKKFIEKSSLKVHFKIHAGEKPFCCEICNKQFSQKSNLNQHIRIHTGQKSYSCEICNKQYTHKISLKLHIRLHSDRRPCYRCEICNKQFMDKSYLNRHIRLHTERRACYSCEICNKQFSAQGDLNRHIRVHTGQKTFSCDICNKQFTLEQTLKQHIGIHTQHPYSCKICNKKFTIQSYFVKHINTHRGDTAQ